MLDMMKMMGKVKELQSKMKEAQESLQQVTAEGEAGAGLVRATVNGNKMLVSIDIDPSLLNDNDKEMAQDLTVAAVNKAIEAVDVLAKEHIKKNTSGMIPNIPGFDISNLV